MIGHISLKGGYVEILDQTILPRKIEYIKCRHYNEVAEAIRCMKIRGAPAIGIAAAMGIALGVEGIESNEYEGFSSELEAICQTFRITRPTAVNLFWAIDRIKRAVERLDGPFCLSEAKRVVREEAAMIMDEDIESNRLIGRYGETLVSSGQTILTHCNAGALATGGYGTALGVIRAAWESGKQIRVFVDETRPLLQGARLTAWELQQEGIPFTLITDSMAGECMRRRMVDMVIVGADRITRRGDVANKIGTYSLALLADYHRIPFYVAAPISTIDFDIEMGEDIPVEERGAYEVFQINGQMVAPPGADVFNPAFDITKGELITGIITPKGIIYPPFKESILQLNPDNV